MSDKIRERQKKQRLHKIGPSKILSDYMNETLRVGHLRDKKKEGGKITVTDEREIRMNDDRKVYVLNNHLFRSMANLIYFFEFLDRNPELIDKFLDDIEDLLGYHQGLDEYRNMKYRNFIRLIKSILGPHGPQYDEDNRFYFQRYCMRDMQHAVGDKVGAFTNRDKNYDARGRSLINTQMFHATVCADYYSNVKTGREDKKPNRIIDF